MTVTNRTYARAKELARCLSAQAIPFQDLPRVLESTDILIGCTGSPGYVVEASTVREAMAHRPQQPLFVLDIAVPRDIDPAVAQIDNVFLHNMDDLESVSEASRREKEREACWAKDVVTRETGRFLEWWRNLEVLPTVIALRNKAEQIRDNELKKTLKRLNGALVPAEVASLEAMTRAIVNKLLHSPTVYLKDRPASGDLEVAREIFRLTEEEIQRASES
jgi:glutamyl-tRNA reductase